MSNCFQSFVIFLIYKLWKLTELTKHKNAGNAVYDSLDSIMVFVIKDEGHFEHTQVPNIKKVMLSSMI